MMELVVGADSQHMFERTPESLRIDPARARFPFCIVWTPLPVISWFVPFIGHIGICREDGVILDFAGPNFVCVDNFTFGAPTRYIQISEDHCISCIGPEKEMSWDDAVRKSTQEFQHRSYNLFTCNCHCFVAHTLNRLLYNGHNRWNVVNLAARIFLKGRWVSKTAIAQSYLPFFIVICIGLKLGGWTFLMGLAVFFVVFVGWFLFGSYFFSDLIQL